jgi:glycosyltransferase involved in cell wall biosynthesis
MEKWENKLSLKKQNNMLISIIIPVYNVSRYIERCLLSVMNQSYKNIECILVDDATPDDSMSIIKQLIASYQGEISFITISNELNQGVSAVRNQGIKKATGEFIYFLDGDDELPPDSLKILSESILRHKAEIAVGNMPVIGANPNSLPSLHIKEEIFWTNEAVFSSYLKKKWYDMAWNKLIKKTALDRLEEPFKPGIIHGEDSLFSFRLACKSYSVVIVPETTYYYHIHSTSITRQRTKKNVESIYSVINEMIQLSCRENLFDSYKELPVYLEKQRVYFIKSLLRSNFDRQYIREQRDKINQLYKHSVWNKSKRNLEFLLKDFVLRLMELGH